MRLSTAINPLIAAIMDLNSILSSHTPTLVEVYASWCPHCRNMAPIVDNLKESYAGKVNILQFDGDAHPQIDETFRVSSYPTWILYSGNRELWRDTGEKRPDELAAMLHSVI